MSYVSSIAAQNFDPHPSQIRIAQRQEVELVIRPDEGKFTGKVLASVHRLLELYRALFLTV